MTREELREIARCYAHDELKDNHSVVEDVVVASFIDGVNYADSHPRWISVEDELPNNYEPVIAAFDRHFARVCFHCGDTWYLDNPPVAEPMSGITHWMPLPQAPSSSEFPNNSKKEE